MYSRSCTLKYYKRLKVYKGSNVKFDPSKTEAHSYEWWQFVGVVDGLVVFNNYYYSSTTYRHQWAVRDLIAELGIKIDLILPLPHGLQQAYPRGSFYAKRATVAELIVIAEEHLCDDFLHMEIKREERNAAAREKNNPVNKMLKRMGQDPLPIYQIESVLAGAHE